MFVCLVEETVWTRLLKYRVKAASLLRQVTTLFISSKGKLHSKESQKSFAGDFVEAAYRNDIGLTLKLYGNSILRVAYSYMHNMSDAEDIVQDTLLQLMRANPSFENPEHEKAWLLRVAINLSKNKLNSAWFRKNSELTENYPVAELTEDLSFVWDAVKILPEKYRIVIHLYYQEEYSTAEIASLLDKKEATVRSLLHRARGTLKINLKGAYDFDEQI
ncbi:MULTISPECIES: RNA polymerase sigma factor [Paenibacillus]|uniref:RNA polymerase sigma factor n=1 Tax=Paenibacillus TaxID=44249 RepID=UPI0009D759EF|nr:sigma-70 family RNA polymerase sigma factor [Paenibacillus odorifer]